MDAVLGLGLFFVNNAPALVGLILPVFVDVLNRDVHDETERFWVTVLLCVMAAGLLHWRELVDSSPEKFALWIGLIFTESQVMYRLYFKDSWLRSKISRATEEEGSETSVPTP